jgi:hypothetical protein
MVWDQGLYQDSGTPSKYKELVEQCWDANPTKRPSSCSFLILSNSSFVLFHLWLIISSLLDEDPEIYKEVRWLSNFLLIAVRGDFYKFSTQNCLLTSENQKKYAN